MIPNLPSASLAPDPTWPETPTPGATNVINVIIADDHAMVRSGLQRIIDSEPGLRVTGQAIDGLSTLALLEITPCNVLMLDLTMPAPSGHELIAKIRSLRPELPVLVVSMHNNVTLVRAALQAGASGYITKDSDPEVLVQALRKVAGGQHYIDPRLAEALMFAPAPKEVTLSPRELQVLKKLAAGEGNSEIAQTLFLSEKTISTHKMNIMTKLGVDSLAGLVRYADANL